jgi:hypothetical protein
MSMGSIHAIEQYLKDLLRIPTRTTYSKAEILAVESQDLSLGKSAISEEMIHRKIFPVPAPTGYAESIGKWVHLEDSNGTFRVKSSESQQRIQQAAKATTTRLSAEKDPAQILKREVKITLNKLSSGNLSKLGNQLFLLAKGQRQGGHLLTQGIFEKACREVKFTRLYAELCLYIEERFLDEGIVELNAQGYPISLLKIAIMKRCQAVFESSALGYQCDKTVVLGNVRFIGELYQVQLLNPRVVLECVRDLIDTRLRTMTRFKISELQLSEDRLEGVCFLLPLVLSVAGVHHLIDSLLHLLTRIKADRSDLSSRIKFLLLVRLTQNLLDEAAMGINKTASG